MWCHAATFSSGSDGAWITANEYKNISWVSAHTQPVLVRHSSGSINKCKQEPELLALSTHPVINNYRSACHGQRKTHQSSWTARKASNVAPCCLCIYCRSNIEHDYLWPLWYDRLEYLCVCMCNGISSMFDIVGKVCVRLCWIRTFLYWTSVFPSGLAIKSNPSLFLPYSNQGIALHQADTAKSMQRTAVWFSEGCVCNIIILQEEN